ncbi:laminin G domain-containing protein [Paenibacillus sp. FSL K6-4396]|uniref:laminin G domain-containing protein n=1 Tax=unclassified Paenibacillus TaxID=185978 RepID=UPI001783FA57|nr:laminin G domain-containing protein [Paenibacillus sp. CFBP 13594]MBD8840368.1 hypothetical protein [Paenibacillus sp. CFBP 13594]
MAGKSKPNILNLGQEASYQVLSLVGSQGSGGTVQLPGLFDGNNPNEWNTLKVMYWQTADNFIEINISTPKVNIWRSGTTSWKQYIGSLKIKYWNGSSYVDVTNNYLQTVTQIAETQWEKTILDLPSGRYRFEYGTAFRLDSEWFIETAISSRILLSSGDKYYSITENQGAHFGTDSNILISPASKYMRNNHGTAIMFRIKTMESTGQLFRSRNDTGVIYTIQLNQGGFYVSLAGASNGTLQSAKTVNDGLWHDVVVYFQTTRNSSGNTMHIYIDDLTNPDATRTSMGQASQIADSGTMHIGSGSGNTNLKDIIFVSGYDSGTGEQYQLERYDNITRKMSAFYRFEQKLENNVVINTIGSEDYGIATNVTIEVPIVKMLDDVNESAIMKYGIDGGIELTSFEEMHDISTNTKSVGSGKTFEHTIDMSKRRVDSVSLG